MMESGLVKLGALVVGIALTVGPVLAWAMLLNLRDRREARLLSAVAPHVNSRDLRGRIAVRVRSGVLSPRSAVTLHLLAYSPGEIWELMTRLAQCLSPHVRLEVSRPQDRQFLARFTVDAPRRQPDPCPRQPTLATG